MRNAVLERAVIQRCRRGVTPGSTITAPLPEDDMLDPDKGLLDQRERYFAQSRATRNRLPAHPPIPRERAMVVAGPMNF